MRICLILEGSYPYVHGGVSTWMHQMIQNLPEIEFVLWVIGDKAERRGKYVYEFPSNVKGVTEVILGDAFALKASRKSLVRLTEEEKNAMTALISCSDPDWKVIFNLFNRKKLNPVSYLQSTSFLEAFQTIYRQNYSYTGYAETFHTMRSMLLPVLHCLTGPIPEADAYHAICTGYGGLLAAMGALMNDKPLLLTEHGIYSREREEEIIRSSWVPPAYKQGWSQFFYMLSRAIYHNADKVSCLYDNAINIQCSIGAQREKCQVIVNGVDFKTFSQVPAKPEDGIIDIGAAVRMAPIKDIKTMIYAFHELHSRVPNTRLHILGGIDDEDYNRECLDLVEQLGAEGILFTGRVNMVQYMRYFDFTILTSISEGQPLTILESFAAGRPCVVTNVGCCKELINGMRGDDLGPAGYCVPPMNRSAIASAMEKMCRSREQMLEMGRIGQERVRRFYQQEQMLDHYRRFYQEGVENHGRNRL